MNNKTSFHYFLQGCSLIQYPGIRRYVLMPILANIVIMSSLFYWFLTKIQEWVDFGLDFLPNWMQWLSYFITALLIISFTILFCYIFSTITNIIAAPFNGLLAEKVEAILTGQPVPDTRIWDLIKDIPRILKRELQKLIYYILWAIPLLLSYLIPLFGQFFTPIIWLIFTAWMINIQYMDYPFDNHKVSFARMKMLLSKDRVDNILLGFIISFFTMIPLLNLIIMPIAVCAATAMWVDRYRHQI
ncbi:sulfate transporter CysZ [Frischella perrara]|uniref:sulfate transporter CysZ n=1 Tax=Frischella perrara TaxID=1267021 RepID=UPI0023F152DD|nr:sulfate transporter CysZ [Frischella perrara]